MKIKVVFESLTSISRLVYHGEQVNKLIGTNLKSTNFTLHLCEPQQQQTANTTAVNKLSAWAVGDENVKMHVHLKHGFSVINHSVKC